MKRETKQFILGIILILFALFEYKVHYFNFNAILVIIIGLAGIGLLSDSLDN